MNSKGKCLIVASVNDNRKIVKSRFKKSDGNKYSLVNSTVYLGDWNSFSYSIVYKDGKDIVKRPDFRKIKQDNRTNARYEYWNECLEETKITLSVQINFDRFKTIEINQIDLTWDDLILFRAFQTDKELMKIIKTIIALREKENKNG